MINPGRGGFLNFRDFREFLEFQATRGFLFEQSFFSHFQQIIRIKNIIIITILFLCVSIFLNEKFLRIQKFCFENTMSK